MTPDLDTAQSLVQTAADTLRKRIGDGARVGLILGTGLGKLADEIEVRESVPYDEIPGFPLSTVESHHGRLIAGTLRGVEVVAMQGRFHLYEGYSAWQVTMPVRVLATLGVETLLISNAAGGMNPLYRRGDLMLTTDHINLQGVNPLTGPNVDAWGTALPRHERAVRPRVAGHRRGRRSRTRCPAATRRLRRRRGTQPRDARRVPLPAPDRRRRGGHEHRPRGHRRPATTTCASWRSRSSPTSASRTPSRPSRSPRFLAAAAEAEPTLTALMGDVVASLG